MGGHLVGRASDAGIPREHDEPVRQGRAHSTVASVCATPQRPQTNLGGLHRLPEHGQVVGDQRAQEEESVQRGADRGRDQSVAVHHAHEAHLSHRLSGRGLPARRLRGRHRAQGRGARREHTRARGLLRGGAQARQEGVRSAHLQDFRVDRSY